LSNKITDQDYLFLSSMIRAREAHMLDAEQFEHMLTAPTAAEAAAIATNSGYPEMPSLTADDLEAALDSYRAGIFDEFARIIPEKALLEAFQLKYDYHNAKAIIKAHAMDIDAAKLLSDRGRIKAEILVDSYLNDDFRLIPAQMASAIVSAKQMLARTGNPQAADFELDRSYYKEFLALSANLSDSFLHEYGQLMIDCANLRSVVRTLRMGKNADFLRSALIPGGKIDPERLVAGSATSDGFVSMFNATPLQTAAQLGADASSGGSLTAFEKACDNALIYFLTRAKMMGFGAAVVVAYLASLDTEITAVRMIISGKLSGIAPEIIRERLRDTYV